MNQLELKQVSFRYEKELILNQLSCSLASNQIVALLGVNGAGKTTLLKLIAGLISLPEKQGEILIKGQPLGVQTRGQVAYLPDRSVLSDYDTPHKMIQFYNKMFPGFDADLAQQLLQRLRIDAHQTHKRLSKGSLEKIALVLQVSRCAPVLLLDEPLASVDPIARNEIFELLVDEQARQQNLVVISSHLISDLEPYADSALMLKAGQIVWQGSCETLRSQEQKSLLEKFEEVFR